MLLAREWALAHVGVLVWRLDPVPLAVAVPAQPPGVVERGGVRPAPAEDDHHAVGAAGVAHARGVLHALARAVARAVQPRPRERRAFHVQAPHVVDRLTARVAAEDQQVRLGVHDHVPLPPPRGRTHDRHDHPGRLVVPVAQVQ